MAKVLIGITGSIAAIKIPHLIHTLTKNHHECIIIVTKDGLNFVTPLSLISLGAKVYIDTTDYEKSLQHIDLAKWADHIIVAPATANTIAKIAHGYTDNLLTSTILASTAIKIIVPAANSQMWQNPITQENLAKLKQHNFLIWGPAFGIQACGDNDFGRMIEPDEIYQKYLNLLNQQVSFSSKLKNKKIVITAGGTKEAIDPVRYISNHSSGKMGYALAEEAVRLKATVTLISAKTYLTVPSGINNFVTINNADEMLQASLEFAKNADIFIGCAAVSDYKIANPSNQKIKKNDKTNDKTFILKLSLNPDIISIIKQTYPHLFVVGFAAETENLIKNATQKLQKKNLDMIIANDVSNNKGFESNYNQVTIIGRDAKAYTSNLVSKIDIAKIIFDQINKVNIS